MATTLVLFGAHMDQALDNATRFREAGAARLETVPCDIAEDGVAGCRDCHRRLAARALDTREGVVAIIEGGAVPSLRFSPPVVDAAASFLAQNPHFGIVMLGVVPSSAPSMQVAPHVVWKSWSPGTMGYVATREFFRSVVDSPSDLPFDKWIQVENPQVHCVYPQQVTRSTLRSYASLGFNSGLMYAARRAVCNPVSVAALEWLSLNLMAVIAMAGCALLIILSTLRSGGTRKVVSATPVNYWRSRA